MSVRRLAVSSFYGPKQIQTTRFYLTMGSLSFMKNRSMESSFVLRFNRMFSSNSNDGNKSSWKRLPSRGWSPSTTAPSTTADTGKKITKNKPTPSPFVNFGKQFIIPKFEQHQNVLAATNVYPLDSRVTCTLVDKKEQYCIDGNVTDMSVSEIVEEFFEKFDPDETIQKMMNSSRWPRDGYTHADETPFTEDEIKKKWNNIGDYAKNRDIWMHHNIARYFNQMDILPSQFKTEYSQFLLFNEEVVKGNQMQPHRTSWPIVAPDLGITGNVDFIGRFPDGTMAIFLLRRTKTLADNLTSPYNKKGFYPIDHVDDCEGSKCYLQLNFLKYILEKYYSLTVRWNHKYTHTLDLLLIQIYLLGLLSTYMHTYPLDTLSNTQSYHTKPYHLDMLSNTPIYPLSYIPC